MRRYTVLAALYAAALFATTHASSAQDTEAKGSTPASSGGQPSSSAAPQATANTAADAGALVAALSPVIGDVQVMGEWRNGDHRGVWRTVMVQVPGETKGNRFFVQQIEETDKAMQVANTTEINEVAQVNGAVTGYRADEPTEGLENSLSLFFDIVPLDGEIADTYELFFTPNEPYTFGPASN